MPSARFNGSLVAELQRAIACNLSSDFSAALRLQQSAEPRRKGNDTPERELVTAVLQGRPPPCESGCSCFAQCAAQKLCCEAFAKYCDGKRFADAAREPSRDTFEAVNRSVG